MCPFNFIKKSESLKRLLMVNALYSFIVAALSVLVPLYLIEKNIDLTQIGLLLAIGPFSFMLLRINFASLADELGTRTIGAIHSIINLVSIGLYLVSTSVMGFAFAIFGESVRTSAFWAIIRTDIIYEVDDPKAGLAFFSGVRQFADALGRLSIGFILAILAFPNSFLLLGALSLILLYLAVSSNHKKGKSISSVNYSKDILKRIFKKHPPTFWQASLLLGLASLPSNMLLAFLIPVYAKAGLGLDYGQIGSLVAIFSIVDAIAMLLFMRWKINVDVLLLFTILSAPALFLFPLFSGMIIIPVVIVAIGTGCSSILYEYMLLDQIYRSRSVSTDIGVINVPLKVMEIIFLAASGFVISQFGYGLLFSILAIGMVLFVIFTKAFIRRSNYT